MHVKNITFGLALMCMLPLAAQAQTAAAPAAPLSDGYLEHLAWKAKRDEMRVAFRAELMGAYAQASITSRYGWDLKDQSCMDRAAEAVVLINQAAGALFHTIELERTRPRDWIFPYIDEVRLLLDRANALSQTCKGYEDEQLKPAVFGERARLHHLKWRRPIADVIRPADARQ